MLTNVRYHQTSLLLPDCPRNSPLHLTTIRSATADGGKAGLEWMYFSHQKLRPYAVKRLAASSG